MTRRELKNHETIDGLNQVNMTRRELKNHETNDILRQVNIAWREPKRHDTNDGLRRGTHRLPLGRDARALGLRCVALLW